MIRLALLLVLLSGCAAPARTIAPPATLAEVNAALDGRRLTILLVDDEAIRNVESVFVSVDAVRFVRNGRMREVPTVRVAEIQYREGADTALRAGQLAVPSVLLMAAGFYLRFRSDGGASPGAIGGLGLVVAGAGVGLAGAVPGQPVGKPPATVTVYRGPVDLYLPPALDE